MAVYVAINQLINLLPVSVRFGSGRAGRGDGSRSGITMRASEHTYV